MPSGAKKRKAAKKKKEKQTSNNNNLQGIDESKSQDDRGSDGGSPVYHDHDDDHQHPFKEGTEEEAAAEVVVEASLSAAPPSEEVVPTRDIKIDEAVGRKDEFGVAKERELKAEEDLEIGDGDDVEAKELDYENGKAGTSSNAEAVGEKNLRDDADSSLKETFTYDDGKSDVEVKSTKELDYENGKAGSGSSNAETVGEKNSRDDADSSVKETVTNDELVESIDSSHAKMSSMAEDAPAHVAGNSVVESSVGLAKSAGTLSEANSCENGNALQEKPIASQVGETEFGMKRKEDDGASTFTEPKPKEFNNEVLSRAVPIPLPKSTNGTYVNDSETPESSENQPLAASAPRMIQKTSWLNCCGLFEVLSGSER